MPPFPKPNFQYTYDVRAEIDHLRQHKLTRGVPAKAQDRLLIATWNIANFGVQETHVSPSSTTAPNSRC